MDNLKQAKETVHEATETIKQNPRPFTAAAAYFIFFFPRLTKYKNDPFIRYHMAQSTGLTITALSLQGTISIVGQWGMLGFLVWPMRAILIYLLAIGVRNVFKNEMKPLPWIGIYALRLFP